MCQPFSAAQHTSRFHLRHASSAFASLGLTAIAVLVKLSVRIAPCDPKVLGRRGYVVCVRPLSIAKIVDRHNTRRHRIRFIVHPIRVPAIRARNAPSAMIAPVTRSLILRSVRRNPRRILRGVRRNPRRSLICNRHYAVQSTSVRGTHGICTIPTPCPFLSGVTP